MAIVYPAELRPTKLELLAGWLPGRPWYRAAGAADIRRVAAYRFDDPAGEVGIETLLVRAGAGPLLQVPLTYRGAPLDGADNWLVGTTEHSVLGRRWVYDACGDPVYATVLAHTIFTGARQAQEFVEIDGSRHRRETTVSVRGSGTPASNVPAVNAVVRVDDNDPTAMVTDSVGLLVARVLDDPGGPGSSGWTGDPEALTLTGTWPGQATASLLAAARPH
ncbi:MAG TPA: hypothetical protein VF755_01475 [Catenuloplanes sp.]|jgi:hypothetical protein